MIFATGTAPVSSYRDFVHACAWIWLHLLLCNVSNQSTSKDEDAINRPWRPLPAGRLTTVQAVCLRRATIVICLLFSVFYGLDVALLSLCLTATTFLYDEMGLSAHPIGKNFCNIWGYTSFEAAAVKMMSSSISQLAACDPSR